MATSALPPMPVQSHRKLVWKLLLIVALSFAFGFALVPLYDVFCKLTGLNGKTVGLGGITTGMRTASPIDLQRIVTVEFTGTVMPGLCIPTRRINSAVWGTPRISSPMAARPRRCGSRAC